MSDVVIEHVKVGDLPASWRARLPASAEARVTVRIEEEASLQPGAPSTVISDDLLFGMWKDREDMADVDAYIRKLRAPRYGPDGSRNEG